MIYTKNSIQRLLDKHERLLELASQWSQETFPKDRHGDMKFEYDTIYEYVNTSCHCHPHMYWEYRGTVTEFYEWLKTKKLKPKYNRV